MKKVALAILLLLALSSGAAQAQESSAAHSGSWLANSWEALADLVEVIFGADPTPTPPPSSIIDNDCGAAIDPTGGGCRG